MRVIVENLPKSIKENIYYEKCQQPKNMLQNLIAKETKRNPVKNTLKRNNKQF